jgi:hypothetical protein
VATWGAAFARMRTHAAEQGRGGGWAIRPGARLPLASCASARYALAGGLSGSGGWAARAHGPMAQSSARESACTRLGPREGLHDGWARLGCVRLGGTWAAGKAGWGAPMAWAGQGRCWVYASSPKVL